tara:strand:- start:1136 stop:1687 length:552 start_codon:yes stop_codon:yes gene_type:complete
VQEIVLGEAVFSDTVCATDPCYGRGTWCGEFDVKVKPGTYVGKTITGEFGSWGSRNWRLTATKENEEIKEWEFGAALGVDAGRMSIYDSEHYDEMNESDSWMRRGSHADPHGFVVSSGVGDGSYHLFVGKNEKGESVALSVVFLFPRAFSRGVFADNESLPFEDERFIPFAGCPLEDFIEEEE